MNLWFYAAAGVAGVYVALNIAAMIWNRYFALPESRPFPAVARLLVVAPHQDDEAIMAGGLMARLADAGAEIRVIVVTAGTSFRDGPADVNARARQLLRNQETLAALAMLGVSESQVSFLGIPSELGLRKSEVIRQGVEALAKAMNELRPDAVIVPAFEGGHPDHDATHYMVSRATNRARIAQDRLFEACEYNGYFLSSAVLARLNRLTLVKFALPPRFIPGRNRAMCLDMSKAELERKHRLLRQYTSQKPDVLVQLFGYPDQFRIMETHDYRRGPYDPALTTRYRICRLLGGSADRCNPFNYGISLKGYAELYGALEESVNAA